MSETAVTFHGKTGVIAEAVDQAETEGLIEAAPKFNVGDRVQMPGVPLVVEVLEIGQCDDDECDSGGETFRFVDPGGQGDDRAHTAEFERV